MHFKFKVQYSVKIVCVEYIKTISDEVDSNDGFKFTEFANYI